MCGLLGFASTEGMKNRSLKQNFFNTGFPMIASDRGQDSSGLALLQTAAQPPLIYKRALRGADFVSIQPVVRILNDIEKFAVAIGHVRAATTARGDATDWNAHPFQYDNITLVHNGHIRNAHSIPGANEALSSVDSAMVTYSMAKNGELETLEQVEGGFVFVWWNAKTQRLNIARNNERPLHMAYLKGENSFFWASELTHLSHLLRYGEVDEDIGGYLHPESSYWYSYDLTDLRKYEKLPFALSQGRQSYSTQGVTTTTGHNESGRNIVAPYVMDEDDWKEWGKATADESQTTPTTVIGKTSEAKDELDEIRDQVRFQRVQDARYAGRPTSKKRLARAENELKKLGFRPNELRICIPVTWHVYKNQQGRRGSLVAKMQRGGHLVEIVDVSLTDYQKIWSDRSVVVECVNVRNRSQGGHHVIAVISQKNAPYQEKRQGTGNGNAALPVQTSTSSIDRDFNGPGGQKVTYARFQELVVGGCANCKEKIEPASHEDVVWVGSPPDPICLSCRTPEILETLGFPEHLVH